MMHKMIEFKEIEIGKLFQVVKGKRLTRARMVEGATPFVGACIVNNGITAYIGNEEHLHPGNVITVAYNGAVATGKAYYQPEPFWASDDVNVLYPKFEMQEKTALYICAALEKAGNRYDFDHKWDKDTMKKDRIVLPITADGTLDVEYMKEFISNLEAAYVTELEEDRVAELEAYLLAAGLDDFELNDSDRDVLVRHVKTADFRVGDLFDGKTGDVDLQTRDIDGKGERFINSGVQNQGIKGRTSRPARIFPAGTITVDFFGNAYLRDFKFKMATHNHVFALIEKLDIPHDAKLYIVAALNKLSALHSFNNMLTWTILQDVEIQLPVTSKGDPDFGYMSAFIRVQKKMAIDDAVRLKDKIIKETAKLTR